MKRLFLLVFGCCLLAKAAGAGDTDTGKVYSVAVPDGTRLGAICAELVRQAYTAAGLHAKIKPMPSKRALAGSSSGEFDAEACRVKAIENRFPTLIRIKVPVIAYANRAFVKRADLANLTMDTIGDLRVGILQGIAATEKLTRGLNRLEVSDNETLFRMLDRGRLDLIVTSNISGLLMLQKNANWQTNIRMVDPPLQSRDVYHNVNEKHRNLVPVLETALQKLRDEGAAEKLLKSNFSPSSIDLPEQIIPEDRPGNRIAARPEAGPMSQEGRM